jgi:transposase
VGQQGTTTRLWARRGARAWAPKDCRRLSAWLFGAVCPARGVGAGLVLPDANGPMMNLHLAEISRHVAPQAHAVLVLDKAKWHSFGPSLRLPDNITLLHLPSVSPELNPVEAIWAYLRSNTLSNRVFDTYDDIVSACSHAWNWLTSQPQRINSIASRSWARVHA